MSNLSEFASAMMQVCVPGTQILVVPTLGFSAVVYGTIDTLWKLKMGAFSRPPKRQSLGELLKEHREHHLG